MYLVEGPGCRARHPRIRIHRCTTTVERFGDWSKRVCCLPPRHKRDSTRKRTKASTCTLAQALCMPSDTSVTTQEASPGEVFAQVATHPTAAYRKRPRIIRYAMPQTRPYRSNPTATFSAGESEKANGIHLVSSLETQKHWRVSMWEADRGATRSPAFRCRKANRSRR